MNPNQQASWIAMLLVLLVVAVVKFGFLPAIDPKQPIESQVIALEVPIVLLVMGKFLLDEVFHLWEKVRRLREKSDADPEAPKTRFGDRVSPTGLMMVLTASVLLVIATKIWSKHL
jgi:hypothetical protein